MYDVLVRFRIQTWTCYKYTRTLLRSDVCVGNGHDHGMCEGVNDSAPLLSVKSSDSCVCLGRVGVTDQSTESGRPYMYICI